MDDLHELPPLPEKSYLGDDVSWGYDAEDMRTYALEAVRREREACAKLCDDFADQSCSDHEAGGAYGCAELIRSRSKDTSNG
jgi:hypothetical protein